MRARAVFRLIRAALLLLGCADSQSVGPRENSAEKQPADKPDNTPGSSFNVTPPGAGNAGASSKGGAASSANGGTTSAGGMTQGSTAAGNVGAGSTASGGRLATSGNGGSNLNFGSASSGPNDCPSPTRAVTATGTCVDRVTLFSVGGAPSSIALGSDGAIWFEDGQRNALVQLGPDGRTLNTVAHATPPAKRELIGGEADAILWFSDAGERSVSKLNRNHEITPFDLGLPIAGLALEYADTVWVTEANSAVYRLQLSDPPDAQRIAASPSGKIVLGRDQNLWFATTNGVGRVGDDGSVTDLPLSGGHVSELCSGPGDGICFSDDQMGRIGCVDANGWTFYPLPDGSRPHRLIAGPDDAIWFTEPSRTGFVSRLGVNGDVHYFPITGANAEPDGIALGSDGNIWFTVSALGKVGRLTPDAFGAP